MSMSNAWVSWTTTRFALATACLVVVGFLCGQVAGAERFADAVRVVARLAQIGVGVFALYFVFSWAIARDRRRDT